MKRYKTKKGLYSKINGICIYNLYVVKLKRGAPGAGKRKGPCEGIPKGWLVTRPGQRKPPHHGQGNKNGLDSGARFKRTR
jgi:hypothetical protein